MGRKSVVGALVTGIALALSLLPVNAVHAAAPAARHGVYYLALGDSLSDGYQPDKTVLRTHGWVYQFRDMLAKQSPIELTNLALGGECTGTFIKGGLSPTCATKTIDSPSQLGAGVAYLKAHAGMVNPITVEIGGDNLYSVLPAFLKATPAERQALAQKALAPLAQDWTTIFTGLRTACPTCTIIAVDQYNPYGSGDMSAAVAQVMETYSGVLQKVAKPLGVRVATVYGAFAGHEVEYTWIAKNDIHANTTGYQVMAAIVAKASGMVQ